MAKQKGFVGAVLVGAGALLGWWAQVPAVLGVVDYLEEKVLGRCVYRFDSEDMEVGATHAGVNHKITYSAPAGCPKFSPTHTDYFIDGSTRTLITTASPDSDRPLLNFADNDPEGLSEGRQRFSINAAFRPNPTGRDRVAVVHWSDPGRRKVELRQLGK